MCGYAHISRPFVYTLYRSSSSAKVVVIILYIIPELVVLFRLGDRLQLIRDYTHGVDDRVLTVPPVEPRNNRCT